jgi:hypothetical protein
MAKRSRAEERSAVLRGPIRLSGLCVSYFQGSASISDVARLEIHTQAALQNTSFNDT